MDTSLHRSKNTVFQNNDSETTLMVARLGPEACLKCCFMSFSGTTQGRRCSDKARPARTFGKRKELSLEKGNGCQRLSLLEPLKSAKSDTNIREVKVCSTSFRTLSGETVVPVLGQFAWPVCSSLLHL